ncbi:MAG: DUF1080 domain-containing protein [Verrucomicrobia bacterium]|nr:DUF1080 domain-containing protein [Verrucomicrobiota bacterium]
MNLLLRLGLLISWCGVLRDAPTQAHAAPTAPVPLPGWRIELIAEAPRVQHPSVVCAAPDGRFFVAEDPMDIKAPPDSRQGRILTFFPDGRVTVFATNLHAVFGMQYLEGHLYVLHNPRFTRFRDVHGEGREPFDLIESTLPNPWALDWNDHVPANFRLGLDGRFYVAVGDKGLYQCRGRDGSVVNLKGGGILRMRPDGTELEIFSTGVRNILDMGRDAEDELFTYDNTDEHQWMGRLTHMIDGGFYGYPHDFIPQRPYTLWMMHDFGAGAATGVEVALEDGWPFEFRGHLFQADFGKRQVTRVALERHGATFRVARHQDLFQEIPEDFRPVGIAFSSDGRSLFICDWQHRDVKAQATVGRLWRLVRESPEPAAPRPDWWRPLAMGETRTVPTLELITALTHPSHAVRLTAQRSLSRQGASAADALKSVVLDRNFSPQARIHALWALDTIEHGRVLRSHWTELLHETNAVVARQMARQLGNRRMSEAVPLLSSALVQGRADVSVRFQAATALGRIGSTEAIPFLVESLADGDLFLRHAAFRALQRIGTLHPESWKTIARGFSDAREKVREGVAFAMREVYQAELAKVLLDLASTRVSAPARIESVRLLATLSHQPAPWKGEWWAYHPAKAPTPRKTERWSETPAILEALRKYLDDEEPAIRELAATGLGDARDEASAAELSRLAQSDPEPRVRTAAVAGLLELSSAGTARWITGLLGSTALQESEWLQLIGGVTRQPRAEYREALEAMLDRPAHTDAVRVASTRALGSLGLASSTGTLIRAIQHPREEVRLAAIEALAKAGGSNAIPVLKERFRSGNDRERLAAVNALGQLAHPLAIPPLLEAWAMTEWKTPARLALARFSDIRALPAHLEALASADPALREKVRKSMQPLRASLLQELAPKAGMLSGPVMAELKTIFAGDAAALAHPFFASTPATPGPEEFTKAALAEGGDLLAGQRLFFDESGVACVRCHALAGVGGTAGPDLTLAGSQFSKAQLIESLLDPSRAVREGYQQVIVETRDGEEIAGALKADTGDGVTLVDASGRTHTIPRVNIVNRRTSEKSLMPDGLHAGLGLEEFRDLVAFVASRQTDPRLLRTRESAGTGGMAWLKESSLDGWKNVSGAWSRRDGLLIGEGNGAVLESVKPFAGEEILVEWRLPQPPAWVERQDGLDIRRHLDAGAASLGLGGSGGLRLQLESAPGGSGGLEGLTPPERNADRPLGDWNLTRLLRNGERWTVEVNGDPVVREAAGPSVWRGSAVRLEVRRGGVQIRNVWVR